MISEKARKGLSSGGRASYQQRVFACPLSCEGIYTLRLISSLLFYIAAPEQTIIVASSISDLTFPDIEFIL